MSFSVSTGTLYPGARSGHTPRSTGTEPDPTAARPGRRCQDALVVDREARAGVGGHG